jgi:hypothetical protein
MGNAAPSADIAVAMMLQPDAAEFPMTTACLTHPWVCRTITVTTGVALFSLGVRLGDFWGLVLMIVGLVPVVIGVADVSLLSEIRDERAHRRELRPVAPVQYERGVSPQKLT